MDSNRSAKIGRMIRFHRKKARMTQRELAVLAGVGKTVIFDAEKGKKTIRLDTLLAILHALSIEMGFQGPLMMRFEESEKS